MIITIKVSASVDSANVREMALKKVAPHGIFASALPCSMRFMISSSRYHECGQSYETGAENP
jgi:hypothetical protein